MTDGTPKTEAGLATALSSMATGAAGQAVETTGKNATPVGGQTDPAPPPNAPVAPPGSPVHTAASAENLEDQNSTAHQVHKLTLDFLDDPDPSKTGRGRPRGSRNKNVEEWADFLNRQFGSPLVAAGNIMTMDLEDLRAMLCTNTLEAFKIKLRCMEFLAPYMAQKLPTVVELDGAIPQFFLQVSDEFAGQLMDSGAMGANGEQRLTIIEGEATPVEDD